MRELHRQQLPMVSVDAPVRACSSTGIFDRMRRFAKATIVAGSARPAISASSIARPVVYGNRAANSP
jgi:hypothetical protein